VGDLRLPNVVVTTRVPAPDRAAGLEALVAAVASATDVGTAAVRVGRRCPRCGRTDHGRPWAVADGVPVGVSTARTTGVWVTAVGPGPVGIDVERVSRVAAAPLDAFTPGERRRADGDLAALTACWAAKEAVLKRDGRGLRVDPVRVDVDLAAGTAAFEGDLLRVAFHRPDDDLVLAVAAGGVPVSWGG